MGMGDIPGILLDVTHAEEVADGCATSEPVSISSLCDELTEGNSSRDREFPWCMLHLSNWL